MPRLSTISNTPRKPAAPPRPPRPGLRPSPFSHFTFHISHFLLCLSVCTAAPTPAWHEPDAPLRAAAFKENAGDRYMLVEIPANHLSKPVSQIRAHRSETAACDAKVVFRDADTLTVLVDTRDVENDAAFYIYALTGGEPLTAALDDTAPVDTRPLRATAYRTSGQEMPATVPGFLLMARRRDRRNAETADCANFDEVMDRTVRRVSRGWDRPMTGLEIASWLVAPEAGRYQFRLKNGGGAFLLVDGEVVARKDDTPGDSQWFSGAPVELSAGLHRVEIYTGGKRNFAAAEFGWRRAERHGDNPPSSILLATAGARAMGRVELRDDPGGFFAAASIETDEPYQFAMEDACPGAPPVVFYPATLKARIANWGDGVVEGAWYDGTRGVNLGDQPRQRTILAATGNTVRATLEARRDDGRAATAVASARVSGVAVTSYVLDSWLENVPAFAFPGDEARPEIHLRLSSGDAMPFDIEATLQTPGGPAIIRERVQTERTWARLSLPPVTIGRVQSIAWSVYHAGEIIQRGEWRFEDAEKIGAAACPSPCPATLPQGPAHVRDRPPAPPCPNPSALHLLGDRLTRGNAGLTLVARRAAWQGPPPATKNPGGPLVILNGCDGLGGPGRINRPLFRPLDKLGDAEGIALLRPFAGVQALPPNARVALIPPQPDIREQWQRDAHARWLSALCGLLIGAGHDVVLVAMPGRHHAEIAFRAADAWGVPIADMYSDHLAKPVKNPAARVEELVRQAFGERGK